MTAEDSGASPKERALGELRSDIELTRERLAQTLDAIEDRLNVPKTARRYLDVAKEQWDELRRDNPTAIYAAAGAVVAVVGGLIALRFTRR